MNCTVIIQTEPFDMGEQERLLRVQGLDAGALVAFQGMVRQFQHDSVVAHSEQDAVASLFLEHYPQVTENEIARMAQTAAQRWPLLGCRVIHRVGYLYAGEPIVLVLVCASHRQAAFDGAQFIMDALKSQAPFWKRECRASGQSAWVAAKPSDAAAFARWDAQHPHLNGGIYA
jgi:molybdopterin synthase catalytic subunit